MSRDKPSDLVSEVDIVIAEWFELNNSGHAADQEAFLNRYPQFQTELKAFFSDYGRFRGNVPVQQVPTDSDRGRDSELPLTRLHPEETTDSVQVHARYRDLRLYKQGGLGVLYAAVDESLHRESVVKFLSGKGQDPLALRRQFQIEAEITARLDHPGVVPVYGLGEDGSGNPFYVMRLVKGRELSQAIQEYHAIPSTTGHASQKRRDLFQLLEHLVRACNTVAYAHDVGIIHCDLKPANIMTGKYGETFVLDWGLAQSFERTPTFQRSEPTIRPRSVPDSTSSGQRGGTIGYISPEQLQTNAPIGPTSDVYSLGATLYHILTGSPPFNGRDWNVVNLIQSGKFPPPRELNKHLSRSLEAVCLKAMSLQPQSRYMTAKHLASDINDWMHDDEVSARPDRWYHRIARYSRRHRAVTAGVVLAVALVSGGAAWYDRTMRMARHDWMLQTSLGTALDTFEDLCRPLANGEMNNLAVLRPVSKRIEDFTTDYLKEFQTNAMMKPHTGRVYELRAIISRIHSSDTNEALHFYGQAEQIYRSHPQGEASAIDVSRRIAQIRLSEGELYLQRHEYDRAHQMLSDAAGAFEKLVSSDPENRILQRELAEVYHCRGEVYLDQDATQDSLKYFEKSRDLRVDLEAKSDPNRRSGYTRDLARSFGYLGDLLLDKGNIVDALKNYELSRERRLKLFQENPNDPEYRFQYARGIANFGFYERNFGGDRKRATDCLTEASQLQERLCAEFAEVSKFRLDLGNSYSALAEISLFRSLENSDTAKEDRALFLDFNNRAKKIYGDFWKQKNSPMAERGANGLATCYANEAAFYQDADPKRSRELAELAERRLRERHEPETLPREELVSLAFAKALQEDPAAAISLLEHAVQLGENRILRIESHKAAGLRAVARHDNLVRELDDLCKSIRLTLRFQ